MLLILLHGINPILPSYLVPPAWEDILDGQEPLQRNHFFVSCIFCIFFVFCIILIMIVWTGVGWCNHLLIMVRAQYQYFPSDIRPHYIPPHMGWAKSDGTRRKYIAADKVTRVGDWTTAWYSVNEFSGLDFSLEFCLVSGFQLSPFNLLLLQHSD